jgi:hypothetical protein
MGRLLHVASIPMVGSGVSILIAVAEDPCYDVRSCIVNNKTPPMLKF